jgi:hypothetical protein
MPRRGIDTRATMRAVGPLSNRDLAAFERDGFVRLEAAFSPQVAARCVDAMWAELPEDRDDPTTWTRPVTRLWGHTDPAFMEAAGSPRWVDAIRQVAGPDAAPTPWMGGTCAIRFPIDADPGDDGWHIDGSYTPPGANGFWANIRSRERALLMLVLYTDVGGDDAPTRIRAGSHHLIPAALEPYGDAGIMSLDLSLPAAVDDLPVALATGSAGDVYLCHPFLVHAAQRNRGSSVRFLSQPAVPWREGVDGFPVSPAASPG